MPLYLNIIYIIVLFLITIQIIAKNITFNKKMQSTKKEVDKYKNYFDLLGQWLWLKQNGISISSFFYNQDIHDIAIYGTGELGQRLLDELKSSEIKVHYFIDRCNKNIDYMTVKSPDESFDNISAIVVTPFLEYSEIKNNIDRGLTEEIMIISIEDIIYEL